MQPTIVPFVKWAGGKRQIINQLVTRLPQNYKTYHEPFVGGGALLFALQPPKAFISDLNKDLMNAYNVIKNKYKRLREYLLLMEYGHSESFFLKIRGIDRNDPINERKLSMKDSSLLRASRFIYLNKAGYNGLYRVNSQGQFNVPSGKKINVKTHEYPNIKRVSEYLKNNDVSIKAQSFERVIKNAKSGDFVYLDPPYDFEEGSESFNAYQKEGFGLEGQIKLAKVCQKLNEKGVLFMVSNHNTKLINKLYKGFKIDVFKAKRMIGGKGASREDVEEVLIRNYENKK